MRSGIYQIRNIRTNRVYIGSSVNLNERKQKHFYALRLGKHFNPYLQNSFNKHGKSSFIFEILEHVKQDMLLDVEQKYLDKIDLKYNICDIAGKGPDLSLEKNGRWKGGVSFSFCIDCGKKIGSTAKHCSSCFKKNGLYVKSGEKNPFYGKHHNKETKEILSKKAKERGYIGSQNIQIEIDGKIYNSYGEASRDLDIPLTTIRWRVLSPNKKFTNYKLQV